MYRILTNTRSPLCLIPDSELLHMELDGEVVGFALGTTVKSRNRPEIRLSCVDWRASFGLQKSGAGKQACLTKLESLDG